MAEPAKVIQLFPDVVADALRVFPGAKIVAVGRPTICQHCDKKAVPLWRRGGKIVERTAPDGQRAWACHFCGRSASGERDQA
jgi:hypothetical protein